MCTKVDEEGVPLLVQKCYIQEEWGDVFNITVKFFDGSYASANVTLEMLEDTECSYERLFMEMWKRK